MFIADRTRILIVDDHPVIARGLRQMLAGSPGLDVLDVEETGETVMSTIANHEPTAIILDAVLPHIPGDQLIRRIRQRWPALTIIAMSASVSAKGERMLIEAGANAVLRKSELLSLREQLLDLDTRARVSSGG